jgi:hypothetical protein
LDRKALTLLQDVLNVRQGTAGRDLALAPLGGPLLSGCGTIPATAAAVPAAPGLTVRCGFSGWWIGYFSGLGDLLLGNGVFLLRLLILIRLEQVRRVQEGAFLLTDIDESCLDPGKDGLYPTQVDVTNRAAMVGAVHQQLYQSIIFQDGHTGFPLTPVDQDLTLQL